MNNVVPILRVETVLGLTICKKYYLQQLLVVTIQ